MLPDYRRPVYSVLQRRLRERRRFIQVVAGPRQAGKTTMAQQVLAEPGHLHHYASADGPGLEATSWLAAQWDIGRLRARDGAPRGAVLVLDEVQKITGWADTVKQLWDEDTRSGLPLRVVLLGSAPLLMARGLTESLAGRFEIIRVGHWTYGEMRDAFGWSLDNYLFFGGYPGAATLIGDRQRWSRYVLDSLIETSVARDVLLMTRVDKPALLRQLFQLACGLSGQVVSYQKLVGQLQDAGNTTTLAHYLELLSGAGMVTGLQKYSGSVVRRRGSSPKLVVLNTALMSAPSGLDMRSARSDPGFWGRLVESAVGAHLLADDQLVVTYWRDRGREVDFVVSRGGRLVAVEVTSGRRKDSLPGLAAFRDRYAARPLLVGGQGIPLDEFLSRPPDTFIA